jgi:translation initiation factor 2B subunit (eIF-2B alpha/beta/delta family)
MDAGVLRELSALAHRFKDKGLAERLEKRARQLGKEHASNPVAQHALAYVMRGADLALPQSLCDHTVSRAQKFQRIAQTAKQQAIHTGSLKLHKGSSVVSDGSPLVEDVLKGKSIEVRSLEGKPAAHHAVRGADAVFLGAARITPQGALVTNSAGLAADLARANNIPVYVVATGLHVGKELALGGHETLAPGHITGIISEFGVLPHKHFLQEVERTYLFTLFSWP